MTNLGIARRQGFVGLWRRTHDLGGTSWDLLASIDEATARYIHDHGIMCNGHHGLAATVRPGIVLHGHKVEVLTSMCRPETLVATHEGLSATLPGMAIPVRESYASSMP